jgi:predicted nucleic acid-binding protein
LNAYVDASVVLRLVFGEEPVLPIWDRITRPVSSELLRVECLRTLDRARLSLRLDDGLVAERRAALLELIASFELAPVSSAVLERAGEPFPTAIGSLDAIHLASALAMRDQLEPLILATHDRELANAARSVGFEVQGSPA